MPDPAELSPRSFPKPQPEMADLPPLGTGSAQWGSTNPVAGGNSGNQLVASTVTKVGNEQPGLPGSSHLPRGEMPKLQIVNNRQVTLEYEVNKFGPSGVGSVELYVTRDDGLKWERYGEGQNLNIPIPADARGTTNSVQRSLTV